MHKSSRDHGFLERLHQGAFNAFYKRSLLYNTCWEDPQLDRSAMNLKSDDRLIMITSAGCNALDYALEAPALISCIDANPRQTALLDLKIAAIKTIDYEDFFALFGLGKHERLDLLYRDKIRKALPKASQEIWDSRLNWWSGTGWRPSFYFYGLSGFFARCIRSIIRAKPDLHDGVTAMLAAKSTKEQREIYHQLIAPRIFTPSVRWALRQQFTMNFLGVPREQGRQVADEHANGIAGFIESCLEYVCCNLPFHNNYFWRVYLLGQYEENCCPRYLLPEHFKSLQSGLINCIKTQTNTITNHLATQRDNSYSKFVLLDHMDWMGEAWPTALQEEWQQIFRCSDKDAQILFRSGARNPQFLNNITVHPDNETPLSELLNFDTELSDSLHLQDRVHTYASFHIASLKENVA